MHLPRKCWTLVMQLPRLGRPLLLPGVFVSSLLALSLLRCDQKTNVKCKCSRPFWMHPGNVQTNNVQAGGGGGGGSGGSGSEVDLHRDVARDLHKVILHLSDPSKQELGPPSAVLLTLWQVMTRLDPSRGHPNHLDVATQELLVAREPPHLLQEGVDGDNSNNAKNTDGVSDPKKTGESVSVNKDGETIMKAGNDVGDDVMTETNDASPGSEIAVVEVCPEVYVGKGSGEEMHPYSTFQTNCTNKVHTKRLVTVLLNALRYSDEIFRSLIPALLAKYEGIQILIGARRKYSILSKSFPSVTFYKMGSDMNEADVWNLLSSKAKTKYVLVGRRIINFSSHTDIDRLLRILKTVPGAAAVGGSSRNESGFWTVDCLRARFSNYVLTLTEDYTNSISECMYCDTMEGPFLAPLKVLRSHVFDKDLPSGTIFADWFLRLRRSQELSISCPDVMFFTSSVGEQASWRDHKSWVPLASKWTLEELRLPLGITHRFKCEEINVQCHPSLITKNFLLPPCCLLQMTHLLEKVLQMLTYQGLQVHVAGPTVLGGVKLRGLLPWEPQVHVSAHGDQNTLRKAIMTLQASNLLQEDDSYDNQDKVPPLPERPFFKKYTPDVKYFIGQGDLTVVLTLHPLAIKLGLPKNVRNVSTKMLLNGVWVPAPSNPGLYARGAFGPGSLRHRARGSEGWPLCLTAGHHACLHQAPNDGSVGFRSGDFYEN